MVAINLDRIHGLLGFAADDVDDSHPCRSFAITPVAGGRDPLALTIELTLHLVPLVGFEKPQGVLDLIRA